MVVFFDAGDTLLRPYPSFARRFAMVAESVGERYEQAQIEAAIAEAVREVAWPVDWTDPALQRTFWEGFYHGALGRLRPQDAGDNPEALVEAMYATFSDPATYKLFPDARPALDALRAAGIRLGLISNFEPWLLDVLELEGVRHLFDAEAVSGVLGVAKPDPAIFHAALDAAGVDPADAVHVGDSVELDVQPALSLGMGAVLIDRSGRSGPGKAPEGTPTLADLRDLTALFHRGA